MIRKLFLSVSIHAIFLGTIGFLLGVPSSSLKVSNLMMIQLVSLPEGPAINPGKNESRPRLQANKQDVQIFEKTEKRDRLEVISEEVLLIQKIQDDKTQKEISILDPPVSQQAHDIPEVLAKVQLDSEDDSSIEGEGHFMVLDVLQEEFAYSLQPSSDAVDSELKNAESLQENYLYAVWVRLKKEKRYPWMARIRGQEGTVKLQFSIDNSGQPEDVHVLESSGWKLLDHEAVSLMHRIQSFPRPPSKWKEDLEIQVPLEFKLRGS